MLTGEFPQLAENTWATAGISGTARLKGLSSHCCYSLFSAQVSFRPEKSA
jgi:hypothetical protein